MLFAAMELMQWRAMEHNLEVRRPPSMSIPGWLVPKRNRSKHEGRPPRQTPHVERERTRFRLLGFVRRVDFFSGLLQDASNFSGIGSGWTASSRYFW